MTETTGMDWKAFLGKYQRNLIQLTIIVLMIIPLVRPFGFPLPITFHPTNVYSIIETLGPESKVIVSMNIPIGYMGDINSGCIAIFHHLFSRNVDMYIVGFNTDGVLMVLEPYILANANPEDYGYVYGEDWCNLGYVPGGGLSWSTFAADIRKAVQYDKYGNHIDSLPMMQGVNSLTDFDIVLDCGGDYAHTVVALWTDPYDKPFITSTVLGAITQDLEPYYQTGQLDGYVAGVTMGAEYEQLVNIPGRALATIDAITLSDIFVLAIIFTTNIMLYLQRGDEG